MIKMTKAFFKSFSAPPGWRKLKDSPDSISWVSPDDEIMVMASVRIDTLNHNRWLQMTIVRKDRIPSHEEIRAAIRDFMNLPVPHMIVLDDGYMQNLPPFSVSVYCSLDGLRPLDLMGTTDLPIYH